MSALLLNSPGHEARAEAARRFSAEFCGASPRPKYILGRNIYAESVASQVKVDGFIDDYTAERAYLDAPIVKLAEVPPDALVLNVAGGRPLSAAKRLDDVGLRNLDYFAFYKQSGLALVPMRFNEGFEEEFRANAANYAWIDALLRDEESRRIFRKLVSFRYDYDIAHLEGFSWKEDVQYFEDFLELKADGETFVDVGGFNGFTSLEFIKLCPRYRAIHVFEPEPDNYANCLASLKDLPNVQIHKLGLSCERATLKLDVQGSASTVSETGAVTIEVDKLDHVLTGADTPTFIKIDIEGGEAAALEGARETILRHHPRLAISVYHKAGDFWHIPKLILAVRDDYDVYLRHYTESIYETVMFFLPKS